MTWDELKEEAKKMGGLIISASSTTPDQMLAIMKALQQEVDDEKFFEIYDLCLVWCNYSFNFNQELCYCNSWSSIFDKHNI